MKRPLPSLLLALGIALGGLVVAPPAQAAACTGDSGVTVVVQFPDRTEVACAPGNPSSGYDALSEAGFDTTLAVGSGEGALCQIDDVPANANCQRMPPASAYWVYFHAERGGSWSYSNEGGGSYDPAPGSVEGWRFGSGGAPTTDPPSAPSTPKPAPRPTPWPTTKPTAGPVVPTPRTPGTTPTAPDATGTATATPSGGPSTAPTDPAATATDGVETPGLPGEATAAAPASDLPEPADDGGLSWIWGVGLIGLIGALGAFETARRRRS